MRDNMGILALSYGSAGLENVLELQDFLFNILSY